ncbi:putative F-box/LRR-repeat protein At4g15060 isoform X2 [Cannabis sativa]|uniref:putative F-box/LRR-repeat protein At4g15060 isoform X2 n=1 Tax=Cannabis sativa TaxID=3483 RepID=UPI0029C9C55F|nr:putative F-box/LRR-repeat protein At4g15060 isoform X2 [Cannabis sativa]
MKEKNQKFYCTAPTNQQSSSSFSTFMAKKSVEENDLCPERKRVKATSSSNKAEDEDRISKLPDAIILHILSFLPSKDLVPTSLLSKRWKLMWYSVPTLSFLDTKHARLPWHYDRFCDYVDTSLERRKRGMFFMGDSVITSFKLQIHSYARSIAHRIDKWFAFAVQNKVKKISLSFSKETEWNRDLRCFDYYYYCLPKTLVVNAMHLTILELGKVELNSRYSFSFPCLESLSMDLVRLADNDVLDKLLLGSPSLEKFRLDCCSLRTDHQLNINSFSLKFLQIQLTKDIVEQIRVANLESLELFGVYFGTINRSVCKTIRNLSLNCDWGPEESSSLEYLISNLPLLENLTLSNWYGLGMNHIKISSKQLKRFELNNPFTDEMTVVIESAPKLESFCYTGNIKFSISMVESSNLLNGTFIILDRQGNYDGNWFIGLMNFFLNLKCCWNTISLDVDSVEALLVPESLKNICRSPLVNWEHLRVVTECKPEMESDLRDALMWVSPSLKTLSIANKGIL